MLVRSVGEVLQWIAVMPQLFAFLVGCFRPTPLLLYSRPTPLLLLCILDVCSLACVASKPQHDGDVSEILSAAKAAGSRAGTSCSAPPTLQRRRSWDSPNSSSVFLKRERQNPQFLF